MPEVLITNNILIVIFRLHLREKITLIISLRRLITRRTTIRNT